MFLERIQIKGFKSIREMDLELRPLNVLIGANGSGKSNFIEVFRLLRAIVEERLQNYVAYHAGADTLLHFGLQTTTSVEIKLHFTNRAEYDVLLRANDKDALIIEEEYWRQANFNTTRGGGLETNLHTPLLLEGSNEFDQLFDESRKRTLKELEHLQIYHFHDTSASSPLKRTGNLHDNDFLRPDGSNLAAFLYLLQEKQPSNFDWIVKIVRLAAPFFKNFVLHPNPHNENTIRLQWQDVNSDEYFDISALSDGTLRFIALTTLLRQSDPPALIIIDEPELGLHPAAITILAGMLESASVDRQLVISTQSTTLINQLVPENVIVVERENRTSASTFKRLSTEALEDWLEDYGLGELWEKNVLGGRP